MPESGSGPGGRRFKSSLPDQSFQTLKRYFWFSVNICGVEIVDGACGVSPQNETAFGSTLFSEWKASMSKQTRYSLAFRERGIRRMKLGDNASKLARELGMHRPTLYGWKHKLAKRRYRKMADLEPGLARSSNRRIGSENRPPRTGERRPVVGSGFFRECLAKSAGDSTEAGRTVKRSSACVHCPMIAVFVSIDSLGVSVGFKSQLRLESCSSHTRYGSI